MSFLNREMLFLSLHLLKFKHKRIMKNNTIDAKLLNAKVAIDNALSTPAISTAMAFIAIA